MPLRARVPAVVTIHDLTFFDHPEWHERAKVHVFRRMIKASARKAAACICVSDFTARRLRGRHRAHGRGRRRATTASTTSGSGPTATRMPTPRRCAGTGSPRRTSGSSARSSPARTCPRSCRPSPASRGTPRPPPRARGRRRVGGRRGAGRDRRERRRDPRAARRVRARRRRPGAAPTGRGGRVPSLEEGFGLPALEALACGAPLVTTSGSAMDELVGDAAVVVPPGDVDALAAGLDQALDPDAAAPAACRRPAPGRAVHLGGVGRAPPRGVRAGGSALTGTVAVTQALARVAGCSRSGRTPSSSASRRSHAFWRSSHRRASSRPLGASSLLIF